jgi:hypothetical protein
VRRNRGLIVCWGSIVLFSLAGCKKVIRINIDPSLAPLSAIATPRATLEWVATSPDESFDVVFDSGLCIQKSPIHASYRQPAVCVVAPQQFSPGNQLIFYDYSAKGVVNGKPIQGPKERVAIGPRGCPGCGH